MAVSVLERWDQARADEEEAAGEWRASLLALRAVLPELEAVVDHDTYLRLEGRILRVAEAGIAYLRVKDQLLSMAGEAASRRTDSPANRED